MPYFFADLCPSSSALFDLEFIYWHLYLQRGEEMDRAALAGLSGEEIRALDELVEANGLDRDLLAESVESVVHLEIFLHHYPRMLGIQLFPYLKSLSLINQVRRCRSMQEGSPHAPILAHACAMNCCKEGFAECSRPE